MVSKLEALIRIHCFAFSCDQEIQFYDLLNLRRQEECSLAHRILYLSYIFPSSEIFPSELIRRKKTINYLRRHYFFLVSYLYFVQLFLNFWGGVGILGFNLIKS